ncbi:DUF488 domain-containing protein [Bacillus piscicola]|uniref:DUF488 domain-containing protein n=1 Tax=Bacillus piscicola TaxID=1632684 RepID=UPI001F09ED60|nr:DUF488 family protein [Bacillus piscicola]
MAVSIKRVYEEPDKNDGVRVLVDGIWPRGMKKEEAEVDHWMKEVAPSKELRQWFNHDADKFQEFKEKYKEELKQHQEKQATLNKLKQVVRDNNKQVTLLFAAKDEKHNQAQVLKEILDHQPGH